MNKLIEIRNQELMCRDRALLDSERREFWLAKAEEWGQRALDEIAFHFRESNGACFTANDSVRTKTLSTALLWAIDRYSRFGKHVPHCNTRNGAKQDHF
jgi:hypothetical protein